MTHITQCAIAIGSDHHGIQHKHHIIESIKFDSMNISWYDVGAHTTERSDYPDYAQKAVALMHTHTVSLSVLLCGTGAGMAMAANRFSKIYAAVAWNSEIAKKAREEDNCNCLVLPADYLTHDEACAIVSAWLAASFRGGHYAERLARID